MKTAREQLQEIEQIGKEIRAKKATLQALKDIARGIGSASMDGMPRGKNSAGSRLADILCKAVDLETEIAADEKALNDQKYCLLERIDGLDNAEYRMVLTEHYFNRRSWTDIAKTMHYSRRWIFTICDKALEELDKIA